MFQLYSGNLKIPCKSGVVLKKLKVLKKSHCHWLCDENAVFIYKRLLLKCMLKHCKQQLHVPFTVVSYSRET